MYWMQLGRSLQPWGRSKVAWSKLQLQLSESILGRAPGCLSIYNPLFTHSLSHQVAHLLLYGTHPHSPHLSCCHGSPKSTTPISAVVPWQQQDHALVGLHCGHPLHSCTHDSIYAWTYLSQHLTHLSLYELHPHSSHISSHHGSRPLPKLSAFCMAGAMALLSLTWLYLCET